MSKDGVEMHRIRKWVWDVRENELWDREVRDSSLGFEKGGFRIRVGVRVRKWVRVRIRVSVSVRVR